MKHFYEWWKEHKCISKDCKTCRLAYDCDSIEAVAHSAWEECKNEIEKQTEEIKIGKNITLTRKAWADGYALGIMSTVECTFEGTMNCPQCKYSSEYNPEHKSQLVCKNNMVKQGLEIINKIGSEEEA